MRLPQTKRVSARRVPWVLLKMLRPSKCPDTLRGGRQGQQVMLGDGWGELTGRGRRGCEYMTVRQALAPCVCSCCSPEHGHIDAVEPQVPQIAGSIVGRVAKSVKLHDDAEVALLLAHLQ